MPNQNPQPAPRKHLERMEDAWDRMSADYGQRLDLSPQSECYQKLAAEVPESHQPPRLLSLGTGLGFELDSILRRIPQARVTCLDVSGKMLQRLRERFSERRINLETIQASYVGYPIEPGRYDVIVSSKTVHHLVDDVKLELFRTIRRGLVDHGLYLELDDVCTEENMHALRRNFENQAARKEGGTTGEWNQNINVTVETEIALLRKAGFSSVQSPWASLDDNGYGVAVFVCEK